MRDFVLQALIMITGVILATFSVSLVRGIGIILIVLGVSWLIWDSREQGRLKISPTLLVAVECIGIFALLAALYLTVSRLYAAPITWSFQQDGYAVPINWRGGGIGAPLQF